MKIINSKKIEDAVETLCIKANCFLPDDIKSAIIDAFNIETNQTAKDILSDLIKNYEIAENENIPVCQDTGMAVFFVEIGQNVIIEGESIERAINNGVKKGYENGYLRKSVVSDPLNRVNTNDNTPAVIHYDIVDGENLKITFLPKGFGSENMSALKMLKPSDGVEGIKNFVIDTVKNAGSNPCPPIVLGIGIGGTMEKAAVLSKKALTRDVSSCNENEFYSKLEQELKETINNLGIGVSGLGGNTTVLGVNIETYPTHIAGLPVAVNVSCHVTRHKSITL